MSNSTRQNQIKPTYPEGTCEESDHAAHVTRLLALGSDTLVDTLAKPYVCLHVPRIKENLEVRRELDKPNFNIGCAVPVGHAMGTHVNKAETSEDGSSL